MSDRQTSPAPSHRLPAALLLGLAVLTGGAQATEPAGPAAAGLQRCRTLADSAARLGCYDALAEQSAKSSTAAAAAAALPAPGPVMAAPMTASTNSSSNNSANSSAGSAATFGLPAQRQNEPDTIKSQIDGIFEGWGPGRTITLSNGQVWQISDGSSAVVYLKSPKVEIRRASMGTFMLELDGTNETARVKRLR